MPERIRDADDDRPYFGRARSVAGLAIIGLVIVLAIVDAISDTFSVDSIQLGLLLGTALLFLGVEAGRKLLS